MGSERGRGGQIFKDTLFLVSSPPICFRSVFSTLYQNPRSALKKSVVQVGRYIRIHRYAVLVVGSITLVYFQLAGGGFNESDLRGIVSHE